MELSPDFTCPLKPGCLGGIRLGYFYVATAAEEEGRTLETGISRCKILAGRQTSEGESEDIEEGGLSLSAGRGSSQASRPGGCRVGMNTGNVLLGWGAARRLQVRMALPP